MLSWFVLHINIGHREWHEQGEADDDENIKPLKKLSDFKCFYVLQLAAIIITNVHIDVQFKDIMSRLCGLFLQGWCGL